MCRLVAYAGAPLPADVPVFSGDHSLVQQSYAPREMLSGQVNADGYGVAWYRGGLPVRAGSCRPIWQAVDLRTLVASVRSRVILASVRNATVGIPVDESGNAPLAQGRWSFVLNGFVEDFRGSYMRRLRAGLPDDLYGWERDDWPGIFEKVMAADILVLTSPIWLGEKSSVCTAVIKRLYGNSRQLNSQGQYAYYGCVGGCLITDNEDGAKHCAMNILYSLQHLGYVIPPQADAAWLGEAGPGPSYLDPGSGGPENDFTNRNTTFMTWNLMHLARMLRDAGGIPAHGNQRAAWDAGCRSDFPNPDYR